MSEDEVELWATVAEQSEEVRKRDMALGETDDPYNFTLESLAVEKVRIKRSALAEKVSEVGKLLATLMDTMPHPRIRLDEVSVSFEVSSTGVTWLLGASAKGGTTFKFKIDPPKQ